MKKLFIILFIFSAFISNAQRTMFGGNNNYVAPPPPPFQAPSAVIGTQQWMSKNLEVVTYRNGDIIPQVTDPTAWGNLTTGAWCYYNNDPANGAIYGKLYNWYAVTDPRGLAPQGWHISTGAEWSTLKDFLGGDVAANNKMMTAGSPWNPINANATNASGFSGLPGGVRNTSGSPDYRIGGYGYWWTADNGYRSIGSQEGFHGSTSIYPTYGFSVRCVKDEAAPFQAPPVVTNGLLLNLDAANPASYSGTGITWYDLSGNNNHGTLSANNAGSLPVFQNGSLYFNGSTSYVSIASSVIPNTSSWTLSTWVKSPSGGSTEMINTRNASTLTGILLTSRGNGIRFQLNNPGVQQFEPNSSSNIMDNTWHLITITVDVSINQMKWYVNNNLANTINFSAGSLTGQGNFVIGWDYAWSGGSEYFRGNIATVSVYNSVLSSSELTTNFNAVKSRFGL